MTDLELPDEGSKAPVASEGIGRTADLQPRELTDVVIAERKSGPASLQVLPPSEIIAGLLRFSFNHYKRPADAFELTTELARRSRGWVLSYEHPADAAELLGSRLT